MLMNKQLYTLILKWTTSCSTALEQAIAHVEGKIIIITMCYGESLIMDSLSFDLEQ